MIAPAQGMRFRQDLLPPRAMGMREWAERFVVIPDGPHKGEKFRASTQPFSRLFFEAIDSGRFDRFVVVAPSQTGKTLLAFVVPILHHLFCIGETVVAAAPTSDHVHDKWASDLLPVIEASPALRDLLPRSGQGSRLGRVRTRVRFRNGATLRFMTGGGADKARASFTTRTLVVTEVDGFSRPVAGSREADKLKQLEARQRAFLSVGTATYLECTASNSTGRIWSEYQAGTASRIARPCPHCGAFVTPERDDLIGWEDAISEMEARAGACWTCPDCGQEWSEAERFAANLRGVLVHRGQSVTTDGVVTGPLPPTRTLGFRWSAIDNHFAGVADVAADLWSGARERDRDNAEKKLQQFVFARPWDAPSLSIVPLDVMTLAARTCELPRGVAPLGCIGISVGIDTSRTLLHWTAAGWLSSGRGHVIAYDIEPVLSDRLGLKQAIIKALENLHQLFSRGWHEAITGRLILPSQVWVDSGWHEHQLAVYQFCNRVSEGLVAGGECYRPSKGYGINQRRMERYRVPKSNADVRFIGPGFYLARIEHTPNLLAHVNGDHWKGELHQRLTLAADVSDAMFLHSAGPADHLTFASHLLAERQVQKWVDGVGECMTWERVARANHWLDASYNAAAAGDFVLSLHEAQVAAAAVPPPPHAGEPQAPSRVARW